MHEIKTGVTVPEKSARQYTAYPRIRDPKQGITRVAVRISYRSWM